MTAADPADWTEADSQDVTAVTTAQTLNIIAHQLSYILGVTTLRTAGIMAFLAPGLEPLLCSSCIRPTAQPSSVIFTQALSAH